MIWCGFMKKWLLRNFVMCMVLLTLPIGFIICGAITGFRIGWNYYIKLVRSL